jgi:hypothetical protein
MLVYEAPLHLVFWTFVHEVYAWLCIGVVIKIMVTFALPSYALSTSARDALSFRVFTSNFSVTSQICYVLNQF